MDGLGGYSHHRIMMQEFALYSCLLTAQVSNLQEGRTLGTHHRAAISN